MDLLISGDLTQESAVLAKNLNITLIDLGHHSSEVPGLYKLKELLKPLNIKCEVVNIKPLGKYITHNHNNNSYTTSGEY